MTIHETLTRLATELESLSVTHIGTRSIQHPDLYRIACELRGLTETLLTVDLAPGIMLPLRTGQPVTESERG